MTCVESSTAVCSSTFAVIRSRYVPGPAARRLDLPFQEIRFSPRRPAFFTVAIVFTRLPAYRVPSLSSQP